MSRWFRQYFDFLAHTQSGEHLEANIVPQLERLAPTDN